MNIVTIIEWEFPTGHYYIEKDGRKYLAGYNGCIILGDGDKIKIKEEQLKAEITEDLKRELDKCLDRVYDLHKAIKSMKCNEVISDDYMVYHIKAAADWNKKRINKSITNPERFK